MMNLDFDLSNFKKINLPQGKTASFEKRISLSTGKGHNYQTLISRALAEECGFTSGTRLDLYKDGEVFMLKEANVGVLKCRFNSGSKSIIISSMPLWLELKTVLGDSPIKFIAKSGMLIFSKGE